MYISKFLISLVLHAQAAPNTLYFTGVTGDGEACRVRFTPDWSFQVTDVRVEGRYTENDQGFRGRVDNLLNKDKVYSSQSTEERLAGPLKMNQSAQNLASKGRLGCWAGTVWSEARNKQRERWDFCAVGERLDEPRRVLLIYSLVRPNRFHLPETAYTRTIDCGQLKPAKTEREI